MGEFAIVLAILGAAQLWLAHEHMLVGERGPALFAGFVLGLAAFCVGLAGAVR